ncbi:MAG TPA: LuxR C-terminal-related transcriptional regulator [Anaerolineae bacterium]|nr:LuxR C-terminal-related transcriptional regulator [Anaerolineae bacterium]
MAMALLKTKLFIPPPPPRLVSRPRLVERLNEGLQLGRKLALISAPAGFGKTTLLSEWIGQVDRPVAWVSLDESDNDPTRFWSYVIAALQTVRPEFGLATQAALHATGTQRLAMTGLLTGTLNELAECPEPLALVLDDVHWVTEPQIHDALAFLVAHLPPGLQLILSTRADPPWALGRLRARGQLSELRIDDLRFSHAEAAAFLEQAVGVELAPETIATLDDRAEGWIAGLQMAALSMRGRDDIASFTAALSGTHRFILDYLVEEILDRQPTDAQTFLLQTSILERMTGPLCDAVTGRSDGQAMLSRLDRDNVFLVPLDDERRWYRYHQLFADLLRSRLSHDLPGHVPTLHRQASEWYEEHGLITEAVHHALRAGDPEQAARLVERDALSMVYRGELATLEGWLDALPEGVMYAHPWLCVARAWALVYMGQLDGVERLLHEAVGGSGLPADSTPEGLGSHGAITSPGGGQAVGTSHADTRRLRGHIAALRAYAAFLRWDGPGGTALAQEALAYLPRDDLTARGLVGMLLGMALYGSGDLAGAEQAFAKAVAAGRAAGATDIAVNALCELADLQVTRGQLRQAAATCQDALRMASSATGPGKRQLPIAGYAHGRLSTVLRERNDLPAAIHHAQACVALSKSWAQADAQILGHVFLARALAANGDDAGALDAIQEAQRIASEVSPRYGDFVAAQEARLQVAMGDIAAARRWQQASGLGADDELSRATPNYILLARVLLAEALSSSAGGARSAAGAGRGQRPGRGSGQVDRSLDQALTLTARLLDAAGAEGANGRAVEILSLRAVALHARGARDQALGALERALSLAQPEGYVRSFIDEGEPMRELLRQTASRGIAVDYVRTLLSALDAETSIPNLRPVAHPGLVEPLTERELKVLRLLAVGLPSKEIARTLVIAVGTVKQHLKHIYGKLEVHNRTEAANRAKDLDLI